MTTMPRDWAERGFGGSPRSRISPEAGLLVYRCWGSRTPGVGATEWGSGYFSTHKPASVLDAELRFNILDWGNGINFVSTFRLRPGFAYWLGPVAHGLHDVSLSGTQVFIDAPLGPKLELVRSTEVLKHDVYVSPRDGAA
jgi:hypothetical protein